VVLALITGYHTGNRSLCEEIPHQLLRPLLEGPQDDAAGAPIAGGAQRRAQVNPVSFTKNHDAFTSTLFRHCLSGTQFGTVSIEMYRSATSGLTILYTMSDVVISQINSGSGEDDFVGLDYRTMKYAYYGE